MTAQTSGSIIGGIVGTAVAGPTGGLIGATSGALLAGSIPGIADILNSLLTDAGKGGIKFAGNFALRQLKDVEKQQIRDDLQIALKEAFLEGVYDMGGVHCFGKEWPGRERAIADLEDAIYPSSLLRQKQNGPALVEQVCVCLRQLAAQSETLFTADNITAQPVTDFLEPDAADMLATAFFTAFITPHLAAYRQLVSQLQALDNEIYDLQAHLQRYLFQRVLAHLGENLKRRPETWRTFNWLMLQSLEVGIQGLSIDQSIMQGQLDQIQAQIEHSTLADTSTHLADLMTAVGEAKRTQDEQFLTLLTRTSAETERLTSHVSEEAAQTRQAISAQSTAIAKLASGHLVYSAEDAAQLAAEYKRAVIVGDNLQLHEFRGIAQYKKNIRLPLADIYQELGLLYWQAGREAADLHEQMLISDEPEREKLQAKRLAERVTDVLEEAQKLVILGDPGAGKTMTMNFIALMLAENQGQTRLGLSKPYLPLLVRLADFAQEATNKQSLANFLFDYVEQHYSINRRLPNFMQLALESGNCMVLLDGLDEVGSDPQKGQLLRKQVVARVKTFASLWCNEDRPNRLVVTSRKEGYTQAALDGFEHMELSPLRLPDEVEAFLRRWYVAYEQAEGDQPSRSGAEMRAAVKIDDLLPQIVGWPSVRRLATNPLLLTILVLIYENVRKLPDRRVKLYSVCTETLIESWRHAQTSVRSELLEALPEEKLLGVMSRLAYWLHEHRPGGTATLQEWEAQLAAALQEEEVEGDLPGLAQQFLFHARFEAGLLAERGLGQIGFFHLTFEEYLAGYALAHQKPQKQQQMLQAHWQDPRWREVILLAAGELRLVMKSEYLTELFLHTLLKIEPPTADDAGRPAVLAGRALLDIGPESVSQVQAQQIKRALRETMQALDPETDKPFSRPGLRPQVRYEAGEVLDSLGWLPPDLNNWVLCPGYAERGGDLWVMKYPVTNVQFERFMLAGGYENEAYWGGSKSTAWQWRMETHGSYRGEGPVIEPQYWQNAKYGREQRGYPVVGVSWYEAMAYTTWLTELLARCRQTEMTVAEDDRSLITDLLAARVTKVELPTDKEWVKIAGGAQPDGRYPWDAPGRQTSDKEAILARANTDESGIGQTSPVGMYPLGADTQFGLMDLSGNVWEWTRTETSTERRALRGGSWYDLRRDARVAGRYVSNVYFSDGSIGFRAVAPVISGS